MIKTIFRLIVLALVLGGLTLAVHARSSRDNPGEVRRELPNCAAVPTS